MALLSQVRKKLEALDIEEESATAIEQSRELIIKQQKAQLLHGVKADGTKIGKYSSPAYAAKKFALNPLAGLGYADLKLGGDQYEETFLDVRDNTFVIDSASGHAQYNFSRYGDVYGLSLESRIIVVQRELRQNFVKNIKQKLKQ